MKNICIDCGKETTNPRFCSRPCAARNYNRNRIKKKTCQACEAKISWQKTYCDDCKAQGCRKTVNGILTDNCTLREVIYTHHHKSSAFALVRTRARAKAKNNGMTACAICGYNKHVEVSHRKPISEYDLDTLVSEINSLSNIWPLCPNHHWEFDHGLIEAPLTGVEPV